MIVISYRFSENRDKKRGYAASLERINQFCKKNGIRKSCCSSSYYFEINGQKYRVSDHSIGASRPEYHPEGMLSDTIYIIAGKEKIIDIYKRLLRGKSVEGYVKRIEVKEGVA